MTNTDICVQSTMDYSIVKHMMGNRVVNPSNVEKIKLSMSNKQLIVPAILNGNMEVIDGQHRLEACKQLGILFYFIIVEGYSLNEVQMVNANMKNWNNDDFLESFIELYKCGQNEFANYVILRDFCKKHEMPLATALILSDISGNPQEISDRFKNGSFIFSNLELSISIASAMKDFEQYDHKKAKQGTFAKVFASLFVNERYSHGQMLKNLPFKWNLLSLMGNEKAARTYLLEIYNHKINRKDRLYEDSIVDDFKDFRKGD